MERLLTRYCRTHAKQPVKQQLDYSGYSTTYYQMLLNPLLSLRTKIISEAESREMWLLLLKILYQLLAPIQCVYSNTTGYKQLT